MSGNIQSMCARRVGDYLSAAANKSRPGTIRWREPMAQPVGWRIKAVSGGEGEKANGAEGNATGLLDRVAALIGLQSRQTAVRTT